jgi:hypothetical protein
MTGLPAWLTIRPGKGRRHAQPFASALARFG